MQSRTFTLCGLMWACWLWACGPSLPGEVALAYEALPASLDFNRHVKPILSDKCYACHGPDEAKIEAGLQLHLAATAYAELPESPGKYAIRPGKLRQSEAFHRILASDPGEVMPPPPSHLSLSPYEKAVLIKWIETGAAYQPHWAFIKPERPPVPEVQAPAWPVNPIDFFVAQAREREGLQPSPPAGKATLLRRVSLDLTGLPPASERLAAFLADTAADAYEKQVDALLASPHYGERMATDWMDVARFADTHGYTVDRYRDMSPWRDWVIQAFNDNLPYDQFLTWQLAGDLLENPTKTQRLATAFNRLHPQNMEGGIIEEEFRVEYVLDRVNTTGTAFMGLTLGCARCHDHKYDPISQKAYFQLSAFFNNLNEAGQISWDDAMPVPTMLWTTAAQEDLLDFLARQTQQKTAQLDSLKAQEQAGFARWLNKRGYRALGVQAPPQGTIGHFAFDGGTLANRLQPSQVGKMKQQGSKGEQPAFVPGKQGEGLLLDGDTWLECAKLGDFSRSDPFSIGLQVKVPAELDNGVIFHQGDGAALFNFRGFHLALKDDRLELLMAHTAPDNAIIEYAGDIPREAWVHLTVTYDGSSQAAGYRLYVNGQEQETTVAIDNLYKGINFGSGRGQARPVGIQVGARWRGRGIKGAVVDDIVIVDRELSPLEVQQLARPAALASLRAKAPETLDPAEKEALFAYYLANESRAYRSYLDALQALRQAQADSVETIPEVMVMKEMAEPRPTFVLERGQYDAPTTQVYPNVPESVLPWPDGLPQNRLGLARWLLHEDHPLTARVTVNRYWQLFFGRGLVASPEDFGNQGALPSHPELLDWLAIWFRENGWDVKALSKLIVMSATYRQASVAEAEHLARDPDNVWLARGPKRRLSSEMLRDAALQASGLLNPAIGGESVRPYQPDGLWAMSGGATYQPSEGPDLYRRSLYTIWKRTAPHPTLATFDQPARSECVVGRQKTNTPLQALVMLNDPTFVEAAKVMGERMARASSPPAALATAYRQLTGLAASAEEIALLQELYAQEYPQFRAEPDRKIGWLGAGAHTLDPTLDLDQVAAYAVVASVILNSDAFITQR